MHQHHSADRACRLDPVSRTAAHYRDLGSPPSLVIAGLHLTEAEALLLTARGLLVPHVNSVYGSTPPCPESRATAAALHLRPLSRQRAILHRLTAAWIYGCAPPPALLECTAFGPSGLTLDPVESAFVRHRYTTYTTYEALRIGPLRVTTPLRTCVDLAAFDQDKHGDTALATLLRARAGLCSGDGLCRLGSGSSSGVPKTGRQAGSRAVGRATVGPLRPPAHSWPWADGVGRDPVIR